MSLRKKKILIPLLMMMAVILAFLFINYNADKAEAGSTNGTISPATVSESGDYVTGTVAANSGYDVATVRYVFDDNTYGFAELTSTGSRTYTYKYPVQTKNVKELIPEFFSTTKWDGAIDISWYNANDTEFEVSTPAQLAGLAALVNGSYDKYGNGTEDYQIKGDSSLIQCEEVKDKSLTGAQGGNVSDTVYCGMQEMDFSGKTVTITADLNMGGVKSADGKWSGPSWTPIGGSYPMDTRGTATETMKKDIHLIESHFNGILNGDGHKITGLYCNRYTAKGFSYSQYIGLVGNLGGIRDGQNEDNWPSGWVPTVKSLSVDGYVYGRRMVGGIVGGVGKPPNGTLIENCANHADVDNTDSKGAGGIVGAGYGAGDIINCYNTGDISSSYAYAGGICANNDGMDIYGCYNTGKITGEDKKGRAIGGHDSGTYTIDNCYYLAGCDNDPDSKGWYKGTANRIIVNIMSLTASQMKGIGKITDAEGKVLYDNLLSALNNNGDAYVADSGNSNSGYPILWFEAAGYDPNAAYDVTVAASENGAVTASKTGNLKAGTVVKLSNTPDPGYVLDCYKANGKVLVGGYYTVGTEAVTLTGEFIKLKSGAVKLDSSSDWTVSADKQGLYIDDSGSSWDVSDWQVIEADKIYQKDKLSVDAILDDDAQPTDINREYTGNFSFEFVYTDIVSGEEIASYISDTSSNAGTHTVTADIEGAYLQIKAIPKTQEKSWLNLADTTWYENNKTAKSYTINTAEKLAGLAYLVNREGVSFAGVTITLADDISLKNTDGTAGTRLWPGIGTSEKNSFMGIFNGSNKTILDMTSSSSGSYAGLFKYCSGAAIKNITVKGSTISVGGGAGIAGSMDGGIIDNCISDVDVTSTSAKAGGIAAYVRNKTTVSNCINKGNITGTVGVGGVVGISEGTSDVVKDCINYGTITGTANGSDGTGGISGQNRGAVIGCANYGNVTSSGWNTGGITGYSVSKTYSKIYDSYNRGRVYSTSAYSDAAVGGIIGRAQYIRMKNSYNAGIVTYGGGFKSTHFGSVCGSFNKNSNNKIVYTYYLSGTCSKSIDATTSYVSISKKTKTAMQASSFVTLLNSKLQSGYPAGRKFAAVSKDYPRFKSLQTKTTYKVTFTGALAGQSCIVYKGGSISLPEPGAADKWYEYVFTCGGSPWSGRNITSNVTVNVTKQAATYTATFKAKDADGKTVTVDTADFSKDNKNIAEPELTAYRRAGYTVKWPSYEQDAADITIKAVYKQKLVKGGDKLDGSANGRYFFIKSKASGVITVEAGANVTLDGKNGMCNDLRIEMKDNSTLTLKNARLASEKSVLTIGAGCNVILEGDNVLKGRCTEQTADKQPLYATVDVNGDCTFSGTGSAYITAAKDNACMDIAEGKTYTHANGTVKFYKEERLGKKDGEGGAIEAEKGTIAITGGTFAAAVNNDGLYAVNVKKLQMTGGQALICTEEDATGKAILAETISISGGSLKTWTEYSEKKTCVYDEDAIKCESFNSGHYVYAIDVSSLSTPYVVKVDGKEYYNGSGLEVSYKDKEYENKKDSYLYIWLANGEHTVSVNDGTAVTITEADSQRGYAVTKAAGSNDVRVDFTKPFASSWRVMAAEYDSTGKLIDVKSKTAAAAVDIKLTNTTAAAKIKIFVFADAKKLIPALKPQTIVLGD